VSVIIPSYNREKLIVKAINSVFNQSYKHVEILLIDDASTDNTEQVIKGLGKENIRYFRLDKNSGQCVARNYGIGKAKGKYVAFLDSDDEWLPEKLKLQVNCFENSTDKLGGVYCYSYSKDMIRNTTSRITGTYYRGDLYHNFLEGFCPPTPSLFLIKTQAIREAGGFDENLITFVDLDMWLRISRNYHFDYIDEPLIIKYEQIGDQYVNNFEKRYKGYFLFNKKWSDVISKVKGKDGLLRFKQHMAYALVTPILNHPPANLRKNIPQLIGLLISIRSTRLGYYLKAFLILLFGPGIIYFIRNRLT